jgi:hypothetical protein
MHVILLALGVVCAVGGAALIVLHLPVDPVLLGLMLAVVGAIAIAGGALLAGISAANRELQNITAMVAPRSLRAAEGGPELPPLVARPPIAEPKPPAPLASLAITPQAMAPPPDGRPDGPRIEPTLDERLHAALSPPSTGPAVDLDPPAPKPAPASVEAIPPKPAAEESVFDTVWSPQAHIGAGLPDAALPDGSPAVPSEARPPEPLPEPPAVAPAAGIDPVKVFRSGVIDGMAYTLYTDGSIEAELPQGLVRFASIEELRRYLEKADGEHR